MSDEEYSFIVSAMYWIRVDVFIPLKKGIMFFTPSRFHSVCLSVCVSVCVCVCLSVCLCACLSVITFAARWLDLETWRQVRSILSTRTWKCNTSQDDPFPFQFNMDHPYKITFWPVTSKLLDGFTPNFTCMQFSAQGTAYMSRVLRSIDKSKCYGHFKRTRVSPKKSSTPNFNQFAWNLQNL